MRRTGLRLISASLLALAAAPLAQAAGFRTFRSPSGNIGCYVDTTAARCDIGHRTWSPPRRPASCPTLVDFGQGLIVTRTGRGHLVCAGDTSRDPSAPVLAYGATVTVGRFACHSARSGMTCRNRRTRHGFALSAQRYRTF